MEYIWTCQGLEAVQLAVVQQLQAQGLAIPRGDPDLQSVRGEVTCRFGSSLFSQPTSPCQWKDHTFQLPSIFVVLVEFLEGHVCDEGLFRKAGSVSRQRSLRRELECAEPSLSPDSNAHDVASLLKQFLRELPHPLVPAHFWPLLEACASLVPVREQGKCLLLACLLLPLLHLQCLCVVMGLLSRISKGAGHSLMDAHNLAIVMAPNLLQIPTQSLKLRDTTLTTQTKIVEMLIEEVSELGKVPQEVGVAASSLKVGSRVTGTKSLDDILCGGKDPLLDSKSSRLTTSISGFLSGVGNMIRRRKLSVTSGDSYMTLPLLRKSVKRSQPAHEEDRQAKRPALEESTSEDQKPSPLTPPPAETDTHEEPDGVQVDGSLNSVGCSPAQPAPPTPLVFTHLRTVKVRYSRPTSGDSIPLKEDQALLREDLGDSSSSSHARETHPSNSHASLLRAPINGLCRNSASTTARGRGDRVTTPVAEDVFKFPPVPTLTPNLLETISSEIDLRKRVLRHSHTHNDEGHTHSVDKCGIKAVDTSADLANRSGYDSRYSATLGIQLSDLPRRKLRGRGASKDPVPSQQVTKQGVRRAGPSSPIVHSASLGITALGQEVGGVPTGKQEVIGGVRQDIGGVIRPRRRLHRKQQESDTLVATPPLPLVRILDSNKSRRHLLPNYLPPVLPSVTKPDHDPSTRSHEVTSLPVTSPPCTGGQRPVDLPAGSDLPSVPGNQRSTDLPSSSAPESQRSTDLPSALQTLQECALPRPSQRFRSPWRWGSIGSRLKYTPVREKGSVSKRAKAYVVDVPRPFLAQSGRGLALKRGASLKENVPVGGDGKSHPSITPLKRSCSLMDATPSHDGNHTHIAVQEWVL